MFLFGSYALHISMKNRFWDTFSPKLSRQTDYTGCFIMLSMITNIYNNKTKGPTLMELFTATGKLKKFSCGCRSFGFLVINVCNHGEHYETLRTSVQI
jgi:hypothetical protein